MLKVNFRDEKKLFDQYYVLIDKHYDGKYNELAIEARRRLIQTDRYVKNIYKLDTKLSKFPSKYLSKYAPKQAPKKILQQNKYDTRDLLDWTEIFYYFSHRLIKILIQLPYMKSFSSRGIIIVRNKLLEHPDRKDSNILINSFSLGGDNGPCIKGPRYDTQTNIHPDLGLLVNATELKNYLNRYLNKAISSLKMLKNTQKKKHRITTKKFQIVYSKKKGKR